MLLQILRNLFFFALHVDNSTIFPKPLSKKEEMEYFEQMSDGNNEARKKLIEHNLRLVAHIVKKYASNFDEQDELISIGTIGLIKAVSTFDYKKGSKFATYASRCIENEILMAMRTYKKRAQDLSIYESIGCDKEGNELPIVDLLQTDEEDVYSKTDAEFLKKTMSKLIEELPSKREKEILLMRYGLSGNRSLTQQEVAEKMGLSRSYISRIEKKSLLKLREIINERGLEL